MYVSIAWYYFGIWVAMGVRRSGRDTRIIARVTRMGESSPVRFCVLHQYTANC